MNSVAQAPTDRDKFCRAPALALAPKTLDCNGMPEEKLVLSTAGSKEQASKIASALVEERLAACVNIVGPIESVYRWQGSVDRAQEFLLLIKTTAEFSGRVQERIRELHTYELPEAIEVDITGGSAEYLRWIVETVG
jgi:periplasmic divalent cation tolerance protein